MLQVQAWILTYTHTRGSEEGPRQPVVGGDLPDVCGDVDESTDHWRDPVKAQQSDAHTNIQKTKGSREREHQQEQRILVLHFSFQFTFYLNP